MWASGRGAEVGVQRAEKDEGAGGWQRRGSRDGGTTTKPDAHRKGSGAGGLRVLTPVRDVTPPSRPGSR